MKTNGCKQRPNGTRANAVACACGKPGAVYLEGWFKGLCGVCADAKKAAHELAIAANMMLNSVIRGFADIGDEVASPQRRVTSVVKTHTNGCYPIPVSYLMLECGHAHKPLMRSDDYKLAHVDSNHIAGPGAMLGCAECRHYQAQLERLQALNPSEVSHTRFRHHDSRGFGPGAIYIYGHDAKSPTGCHLLFSIDETAEVQEVLRSKLRSSPLSPTERR